VLRGYLEWGDAVAERLNGTYAFAVWDGRADKLVMVRDRMGIKPFYYHPTPDGVLFGSEPKAILANPLVPAHPPGRPARTLHHDQDPRSRRVGRHTRGRARHRRHRRPLRPAPTRLLGAGDPPHTDDRDTTVATVRELLDDIVHRQLVADVPRAAPCSPAASTPPR
jgi:asparagine synthase (glutamine-hydrolysing)